VGFLIGQALHAILSSHATEVEREQSHESQFRTYAENLLSKRSVTSSDSRAWKWTVKRSKLIGLLDRIEPPTPASGGQGGGFEAISPSANFRFQDASRYTLQNKNCHASSALRWSQREFLISQGTRRDRSLVMEKLDFKASSFYSGILSASWLIYYGLITPKAKK
jgi:hypothetical protein